MDNRLYASLEKTIAHSDEVDQILGDHAFEFTLRARARLAAHRHLGEHKITQTKGTRANARSQGEADLNTHGAGVDHYINLVGPAAMSVEEGHHNHWNGEWVEGLHIVRGAIWNVG